MLPTNVATTPSIVSGTQLRIMRAAALQRRAVAIQQGVTLADDGGAATAESRLPGKEQVAGCVHRAGIRGDETPARRTGALGGPALAANTDRTFAVTGACGIPATAGAISVNLTVTQPSAVGDLRLYPGGTSLPPASSINYAAGQTRANNATVLLGPGGTVSVRCVQASGNVHFLLDVNGYYR